MDTRAQSILFKNLTTRNRVDFFKKILYIFTDIALSYIKCADSEILENLVKLTHLYIQIEPNPKWVTF
ncbi:hypothetical protein BB777_16030 [Planococcus faecalis]|nr:hypothetical protein BB777_16030 [Planococcus faecalis]